MTGRTAAFAAGSAVATAAAPQIIERPGRFAAIHHLVKPALRSGKVPATSASALASPSVMSTASDL